MTNFENKLFKKIQDKQNSKKKSQGLKKIL